MSSGLRTNRWRPHVPTARLSEARAARQRVLREADVQQRVQRGVRHPMQRRLQARRLEYKTLPRERHLVWRRGLLSDEELWIADGTEERACKLLLARLRD